MTVEKQMARGELARMVSEADDWLEDRAEDLSADLADDGAESASSSLASSREVVYDTYSRTEPDRVALPPFLLPAVRSVGRTRREFPLRRHDEY